MRSSEPLPAFDVVLQATVWLAVLSTVYSGVGYIVFGCEDSSRVGKQHLNGRRTDSIATWGLVLATLTLSLVGWTLAARRVRSGKADFGL